MRTATFSVSSTLLVLALLATGIPASAATSWFAPYQQTTLANGQGPGPAPRGTASGDFNSDGRPDIVSINNFGNADILYVPNTGNGTFGTPSTIANTRNTQGLDVGDVNGDRTPDVVAMTTNQVLIRFGNGAGGFTAGGTYPLSLGGQVEPRVLDLDRDGDLDIVAPTFTAIQTLLNSGNGSFSAGPTTQVPGTSAISAIDPANLDKDGKPDLFAVDGSSGTTYALKGTGAGAFTVSGQLYGTAFVPEDVTALDLDGDGCDDAATIGSFSFTVATGLTDCTGKFRSMTPAVTQYSGPGPTSAAAADINRDGKTDLVISSLATYAPKLKVLAGNGTAKMAEVGDFALGTAPQNPVVADYNGDAKLDIVTVGPGNLSYLRNTTP